ncbi:hypothetical protein Tco_1457866 [Tanacetum coccineum]
MLNEPVPGMIMFNSYHRQDFVTIEDFRDFLNEMLRTIQEIFFRLHQGPGIDDHAKTFNSFLLAEVDKRNLNPLKQIRVIEQLRYIEDQDHLHFSLCGGTETEDKTLERASVQLGKRLHYAKRNKAIYLGNVASKVDIEVQQLSLKDCTWYFRARLH